jgi:UDP-GlcNAc:undecaprenyl-phosphate/decaprenyl-phosphate GlcNAc-1-phosphate transferase
MQLLERVPLVLAVGGPAFLLAMSLVPLARRAAGRLGALDEPGDRKLHESIMPRTGGIAIYIAFVATVGIGYFLLPGLREETWLRAFLGAALDVTRDAYIVKDKLIALLAGATLAFATGLADDVLGRRFPVAVKALGQVLAAGVVMSTGVRTSFMPTEWLNWLATLLWLVGITNAFNLLDNMDGLAAGVAFVASGVLLLHAWALGEFLVAVILLAFMGSLLGFLFFNFHPASVFLGDCGSHFIGFVMASIMLLERYVTHASSTLFPLLMPVLLLAVPLIDTTTVILIRVREGRPIYVGDQRHLSHRLLALGFTQRSAALFLYLVTFCLGVGALLLPHAAAAATFLILLQSAGFVALILFLMFLDRRPAAGSRIE